MSLQYDPELEDQVLGIILSKHSDHYRLDIGSSRSATLPLLGKKETYAASIVSMSYWPSTKLRLPYSTAFEGATKRNRPNLSVGDLVFARVVMANKDMKAELSCISLQFKKDWMTGEALFGPLQDGYDFRCSTALVRRFAFANSIPCRHTNIIAVFGVLDSSALVCRMSLARCWNVSVARCRSSSRSVRTVASGSNPRRARARSLSQTASSTPSA